MFKTCVSATETTTGHNCDLMKWVEETWIDQVDVLSRLSRKVFTKRIRRNTIRNTTHEVYIVE